MIIHLNILSQYRELLWIWINREIKIRYKQSFLGASWAILQPLIMMIVFTAVFSIIARIPTDEIPYPIFSYTALLPWTFFATSITFGSSSLINNLNLVTKTYFPREILPIGSIGAGFFDYLIASSLFILMLLIYQVRINWTILWVPVILFLQILLTLGVTFTASALTVIYRDLRFVVPLGIQIWFFASPIIYPITLVPENLLPYYMVNPMAGIIDSYRQVFLFGKPPVWEYLGLAAIISILFFLFGYSLFKRLENSFPDII